MSCRLSIPLSISFFQAPNLPDCNLLYFFYSSGLVMCWSIHLVEPYPFLFYSSGSPISWSNCPCCCYPYVFRQATPTYSFVYLFTKDVPSGSLTRLGTARRPGIIFSLIFVFSYAYHQKIFLIKALLLHQGKDQQQIQ